MTEPARMARAGAGVLAGLWLLVRGFGGYRTATRIADTGTSRIATMAAGDREERAVGFAVRDATGSVRMFPRGVRWDAPIRFEGETGRLVDEPPGLRLRTGSAVDIGLAVLVTGRAT